MTIGKGKRPRDPNQLAAWTVAVSTGQIPEPEPEPPKVTGSAPSSTISEYMAAIGRKGGQIGGKRRLKTMTKAQRQRVAAKAAKVRQQDTRHSESQPVEIETGPLPDKLVNPMRARITLLRTSLRP